jgi:hypothetical protein
LSFERQLPESRLVDGEISINAYGFGESPGWDDLDTTGRLKLYRVWGRFKTSRFEGRVGLQKINFGSALLLRPLRWFDSVDPRDPLQITEGVYGLLVREYFPRNFTVWAWGLYGNEHLKGLEFSPTRERTPEYGGRFQAPLSKGEIAFTTHHRRADLSKGLTSVGAGEDPVAREHRYGLDGKWDIGIGLWFEAAAIRQTRRGLSSADSGALTLGADYTFGVGNGLHVPENISSRNVAGDVRRACELEVLCGVAELSARTARQPVSDPLCRHDAPTSTGSTGSGRRPLAVLRDGVLESRQLAMFAVRDERWPERALGQGCPDHGGLQPRNWKKSARAPSGNLETLR